MKQQMNPVLGDEPCNIYSPCYRVNLTMWKQLEPATLDKLGLLTLYGSISSRKRKVKIPVTVQMLGFYRLSFSNHILVGGKTTSRHATPRGDGRGVPKHFRDFGRFSRCSTAFSQPTLPEGFALGRQRLPSVFQSQNPTGTVTIFVVQGKHTKVTLIRADITKMDFNDTSSAESLFDLIDTIAMREFEWRQFKTMWWEDSSKWKDIAGEEKVTFYDKVILVMLVVLYPVIYTVPNKSHEMTFPWQKCSTNDNVSYMYIYKS